MSTVALAECAAGCTTGRGHFTAAPPPASPPAAPLRASPSAAPVSATPLVRTLAREHKLDLTGITGTGPGGRIVRADIEAAIGRYSAPAEPASAMVTSAGSEGDERVRCHPYAESWRAAHRKCCCTALIPHLGC